MGRGGSSALFLACDSILRVRRLFRSFGRLAVRLFARNGHPGRGCRKAACSCFSDVFVRDSDNMRRECPVFVRAKRSVIPYLTAGRPGFNASVATETAGKASSLYGGSQNLARFCGVRTGRFCGSDGFAGGRQNGRESCDRLFVMRTDNLRAAVAVILLDFQSLKNVALGIIRTSSALHSAYGLFLKVDRL